MTSNLCVGLQIPTLAAVEMTHIRDVMGRCGGNKPLAAGLLGISVKTLYNKLNAAGELDHWKKKPVQPSLEVPFALRLAETPLDYGEAQDAAG